MPNRCIFNAHIIPIKRIGTSGRISITRRIGFQNRIASSRIINTRRIVLQRKCPSSRIACAGRIGLEGIRTNSRILIPNVSWVSSRCIFIQGKIANGGII